MQRPLTLAALVALGWLAHVTPPAMAQSAPGLSNSTFISSQKLRSSRAEAVNTASAAERRDQMLAIQDAQIRLLDAQARAAAQPMMRVNTGGPSPVSIAMPTGSGLLPNGGGETNYHVNVQVGEGNQSAITTTSLKSDETITSDDQGD